MADLKAYLSRLYKNLNILHEREAKYGGNSPLDLLNQIGDHRQAIALTEQAIAGDLDEAEWQEALKPLLISISPEAVAATISQSITGSYNVQVQGEGAQGTLNVTHIHEAPKPRLPLIRPSRAAHFTDRQDELAKLLADLQPGRVVTLCGPGGIGKTALAAEAIWTLAPGDELPALFPDGLLVHSFYNQPQVVQALEAIAHAFGEEPKPTPHDAARRALAGRKALLLLDGVEEADNLPAVLEVTGGCGVIVTSRKRKDAVDERQDIQPLPTGEAVKLLQAWSHGQAADIGATEQICELVGRLPLAVRLVGKYLDATSETVTEYLAWLQETPLTALDQGQQRVDSVSVLLQESLAQVSETARQVLGVVGLLALAPFGREPVAAALELTEGKVQQPLGELVSFGLLLRSGERYEVSHSLIHTYARRRLAASGQVAQQVARYYADLAQEQSKLGLVGYLGSEGYARLDTERAHFISVLVNCHRRGEWQAAQSLAESIDLYLHIRAYWTERNLAIEAGLAAARGLNNRRDEGIWLDRSGAVYRFFGQIERASEAYKQALSIAQEMGDRSKESYYLADLGSVYRDMGQVERAIKAYEQALSIAQELGNRRAEGFHLSRLGTAHLILRQFEQAIVYYQQSLTIMREIGHRPAEGFKLGNLGMCYQGLGQVEKAIEYYEQALFIIREVGDRDGEAFWLGNIGELYKDQSNASLARQYLEQALDIFEEIKSPDAAGIRKLLAELESSDSETA